MNVSDGHYWFPAKRHGWGWGPPTAWQGWAVLFMYLAVVGTLAYLVRPSANPTLFYGLLAFATALLVLVCWLKGEPPNWHWGKR